VTALRITYKDRTGRTEADGLVHRITALSPLAGVPGFFSCVTATGQRFNLHHESLRFNGRYEAPDVIQELISPARS
jgi:hypothetical protein